MRTGRAAAVVTWVYVGSFGVPTIPVAVYWLTQDQLPSFLGLFEMYGGPWSTNLRPGSFALLLAAFGGVTGAAGWSAWRVWQGRRAGAVVNLALLPLEAVFWIGFALPFPWLFGIARAVLLALTWRTRGSHTSQPRSPAQIDTPSTAV